MGNHWWLFVVMVLGVGVGVGVGVVLGRWWGEEVDKVSA
jgi:membrane protein DedA with SNARE-associated domain